MHSISQSRTNVKSVTEAWVLLLEHLSLLYVYFLPSADESYFSGPRASTAPHFPVSFPLASLHPILHPPLRGGRGLCQQVKSALEDPTEEELEWTILWNLFLAVSTMNTL